MAARCSGRARGAVRHRRTRAVRQPRDLAGRRACPGAGGLGISRARGSRALVPGARRRRFVGAGAERGRAMIALLAAVAIQAPGIDSAAPRRAGGHATPTVTAVRADRPPTVDGRLDEAAWAQATPVRDLLQSVPDEGRPVSESTEVRIVYGGDALYVGARLFDAEPGKFGACASSAGSSARTSWPSIPSSPGPRAAWPPASPPWSGSRASRPASTSRSCPTPSGAGRTVSRRC